MQQLERALRILSDRAEALPTQVLVDRIESELRAAEAPGRGTATVKSVMDRPDIELPPVSRRSEWRRPPGWAAAAAAAALLLLLVGGAGWLLRSDSSAPPATSPIDAESLEWTRLPLDAAVFDDARIESVTVFQDRLVAAGKDASGVAVWNSDDAITWSRISVDVPPGSGERAIRALAPGGPGLVAIVGFDTVWTSPDGITWTASEQRFTRQLEAVAPGGPGLVMVGDGPAYTSVDGMEWTAAQCPGCTASGEFDYMADVAAGGPGLIGVGNFDDPGEGPAFYWTSPDGRTWTRVPFDQVIEMESITAGGPGFVAVGRTRLGSGVLTSADGTNWTLVPHDDNVFGNSIVRRVVAFEDGLIALGHDWQWGNGQAWASPDGTNWARVPGGETLFGDSFPVDAVAFEDRVVVVGESSRTGGPVWIAAPPGILELPTTTIEPGGENAERPLPVPTMGFKQALFGDGDIHCPDHWADDQTVHVGSVTFMGGNGQVTVLVELTAAAPDLQYRIEIVDPDTCQRTGWAEVGPFDDPISRVLQTDGNGAGRLEAVIRVEPGIYRLNVNVVHNDWENNWPGTEDIRLREIGGAGFSLVEVG